MTLIEVLIAIALLVIVATGAVATFSTLLTANRSNTSNTKLQAATLLKMEEYRSIPFNKLWDKRNDLPWNETVDDVTVGISLSEAGNGLVQIEITGSKPGREGGVFTLVTMRASKLIGVQP
jgi:type II secretory pathway pseudopilin PulG